MGLDIATFQNKLTEVASLSWYKETTGQAQNLATGRDNPIQPLSSKNSVTRLSVTFLFSSSICLYYMFQSELA